MGTQENKALIRRFVDELNRGKQAKLDDIVHPDYSLTLQQPVIHSLVELKQAIDKWPRDQHYTIEDILADGDRVVYTWISTSTRDGQPKKSSGITVARVSGGKIIADHDWSREISEP